MISTPDRTRRPRCPISLLLALAMGLQALVACGNESARSAERPEASETADVGQDAHSAPGDANHDEHEGLLRIAPEVQQRFGISTLEAEPGSVEVTVDLPGEIVPDPDRVVHVKPPFAGTIRRVDKHVGDRVEPGDTLAVLESAQALAPYTIKASIAGVVTDEHAAVGESVDSAHELFTVADTSTVWVQLQVFPSELARVRVGDLVEILSPNAESGTQGEISFISPVLDHATRTATARIVLENDGTYQPGLFVTGRVAVAREDVPVSVPTSALIREGRGWVVFVRDGNDTFGARPVEVGHRGIERSAIEAGLQAGEQVVTNGAFLVKSAAARGEMGGGHSH